MVNCIKWYSVWLRFVLCIQLTSECTSYFDQLTEYKANWYVRKFLMRSDLTSYTLRDERDFIIFTNCCLLTNWVQNYWGPGAKAVVELAWKEDFDLIMIKFITLTIL